MSRRFACPVRTPSPGSRCGPAATPATDGRRTPTAVRTRTGIRVVPDLRRGWSGRIPSPVAACGRDAGPAMDPDAPVPVKAPPAEPIASVAEDLPALYRAILERVADLERVGAR